MRLGIEGGKREGGSEWGPPVDTWGDRLWFYRGEAMALAEPRVFMRTLRF